MRAIGLGMVVLAGLAATAPGADDPAKPLRGKWTLDKAAMVESSPAYQAATPEQKKEIRDNVMQGMPDAVIEFTEKEVSFTADPKAAPETATYRVLGGKDGIVEMEIISKDKAGKETIDKTTAELKGEVLTLKKDGDPFVMVLRRAK
jgi:hypothetical protein